MELREKRYLAQCRYNGEWIYMAPAEEQFLRTPRKVLEDIDSYREMDATELEYRIVEMQVGDQGLEVKEYFAPETFNH